MPNRDLFGDVTTADSGVRSDLDFYETPAWMTRSLLLHTPEIRGGTRVLECCSGRDAIAKVLRQTRGCQVFTNDLDSRHVLASSHGDATTAEYWAGAPHVDWIISNLPFTVAFAVLQLAFGRAHIAFLLRKTFLEPTLDRGPWLSAHPPDRIIGLPRYAFRGAGSDSVSCDWMIWHRTPGQSAIMIDHYADRRQDS